MAGGDSPVTLGVALLSRACPICAVKIGVRSQLGDPSGEALPAPATEPTPHRGAGNAPSWRLGLPTLPPMAREPGPTRACGPDAPGIGPQAASNAFLWKG